MRGYVITYHISIIMEHLGGLRAVAFWPETAFSTTVENRRCCGLLCCV